MHKDIIDIVIGGLYGALFSSAFFSALTFTQQMASGWGIFIMVLTGHLRRDQLIGLASFGWLVTAISTMIFVGPRIVQALFFHQNPIGLSHGYVAIWVTIGIAGWTLGYFLPVLAMQLYRGKTYQALGVALWHAAVGCYFAWLSYSMPLPIP